MTCSVCGAEPCINPSFCKTCRKADATLAAERKAGRQRESATGSRAAGTTVEALAFQLRAGADALREPSTQRRLSELDQAQMREVAQRLTKPRWGKSKNGETPARVPPWRQSEIETFVEIWRNLHGR
jgi:hypothetical protein